MDHDDSIAHLLGNFQFQEISDAIPDEQLLTIINDCRLVERRPNIDTLPTGFVDLNQYQRFELVKRLSKDIATHDVLKTNLEDDGYICINKTELKLIELNRAVLSSVDNVPITRLPYNQVDADDLSYYYPQNTDRSETVFVTDSDCRLISTPTYVTSGQCFIAKHKLQQPFQANDTILPFESQNLIHSTPVRVYTPSNSDKSSLSLNTSSEEKDWQRRYIQVIHKYAKKRPRMSTDGSDESRLTIDRLEKEKADLVKQLAAKNTRQVPVARSERDELNEVKERLDLMTDLLAKTLQIDPKAEGLTGRGKTGESVLNEIYKLKYPTNIIPIEDEREQETLAILKPSVIANTIGSFEPMDDEKMDFRGIWERILEHTKNSQLYEHEYLSILRMVMKGKSARHLDNMTKEANGNLAEILVAIQDLYIPQMTFFDEFDELNGFARGKNEHIRTTVRRAALAIYPIKATVAPAAWEDRKYTLIMQIIKQVIDRKTFEHLRMEELKCAHSGTQLSLDAVITCVSLFETTNNLIPGSEIKLSYNVNTMQITNQPDKGKTELEELRQELAEMKYSMKMVTPKKARFDKQGSQGIADRVKIRGRRRLNQNQPMQIDQPQNKGIKRPAENDKNYPVVPYQGPQQQTYAQKVQQKPNQTQVYNPAKPINQYQGNNYRQSNPNYQNQVRQYPNNSGFRQNNSYQPRQYNPNRGRGGYRGRARKTYNFKRDKQDIVLNFYKCELCPNMHPDGTACNAPKRDQTSLNGQ